MNMKRATFLIGGLCWFLFALGFGFFLVQYVCQGAGLQFFGPAVSSGTVLMGLVHVVGLVTASFLCFAIGAGLSARGILAGKEGAQPRDAEPIPINGIGTCQGAAAPGC